MTVAPVCDVYLWSLNLLYAPECHCWGGRIQIESFHAVESEKSLTLFINVHAAGLSKEVKAADSQLKDLRRTVEYVDNNRESFTHIDHVSMPI